MKKSILTAVILAATASIAFAQAPSPKDDSSLSTKAMEDQPGTTGGSTDMPTAKPTDSSLSDKAKKDQAAGNSVPATDGASDGTSGSSAMPAADSDKTKKMEGTSDPAAGK